MKLTATDFQDPLLQVLGTLTAFTVDVPVLATDIYSPVMDIMGIRDINEHGAHEPSGQPMVIKWIQRANINCRKAGFTASPPKTRGKWTLTEAGVLAARKLVQNVSNKADAMTTRAALAPVISLAPVPFTADPSGYHPDAYVRRLAIEQTPCIGKYSPHGAAICCTCPLHVECQNRQRATFSALASLLATEDTIPDEPPLDKSLSNKTFPNRFAGIDFATADVIMNRAEAICIACGQPIANGEKCRWVEELPSEDGDSGLFHMTCSGGE